MGYIILMVGGILLICAVGWLLRDGKLSRSAKVINWVVGIIVVVAMLLLSTFL